MSKRREQLVPGQADVIVFENYVSSPDGETIRIDVQHEARLAELEAITRKLGTGESNSIHLSEIKRAHWVSPLVDVALSVSAHRFDARTHSRGGQLVCEWTESAEGWLKCTEKIAHMRTFGLACHQYFGGRDFGGRDAESVTIEVAYLE
jgi:hypothetical protein